MRWEDLPKRLDKLAADLGKLASDVRSAVSGVFTRTPVGYFVCPANGRVAVHGDATAAEFALCKSAAARAVGRDHVRAERLDDVRAACGEWVKVAYSPAVRRVGESLNFFPGTYPGGIPNHPSPLAAVLASALVGGGLGYGLGWLGEKVLPDGYGKRLKRTGALLGAGAASLPAAAWGVAGAVNGHSPTESWPFGELDGPSDSPADARRDHDAYFPDDPAKQGSDFVTRLARLDGLKIGSDFTRAAREFLKKAEGDFYGNFASEMPPTPYDVNVNHLGQTLWQTGASNPLVGAAMGTMYAAQQLPDPNARPGWATGNQLGQLAMNAGKDYLTGLAFGALVNKAVGTPYSAPSFGAGNLALGLVRAGVQSLLF